jgi:hypothetical protein
MVIKKFQLIEREVVMAWTVKELRDKLSAIDQDFTVILSEKGGFYINGAKVKMRGSPLLGVESSDAEGVVFLRSDAEDYLKSECRRMDIDTPGEIEADFNLRKKCLDEAITKVST